MGALSEENVGIIQRNALMHSAKDILQEQTKYVCVSCGGQPPPPTKQSESKSKGQGPKSANKSGTYFRLPARQTFVLN